MIESFTGFALRSLKNLWEALHGDSIDFREWLWHILAMVKIRFTALRDDYPEEELDEWGDVRREWGQFKSTVHDTLDKIAYELDRLDVEQGIIELDVSESDLRRARGKFPSVSEPYSPRVRLTFSHPEQGPLQYPCGNYCKQKDNLRAIALTLEAQRAIERYGATKGGQQYAGWKGLPPGEEQERYFSSPQEAAEYVAELAGFKPATGYAMLEDGDLLKTCYLKASKKAHPDTGGNDETFQTLQQAKEIIDHHLTMENVEVA